MLDERNTPSPHATPAVTAIQRVGVVRIAHAAGIGSLIAVIVLGEPVAYTVMGALSAWLRLPTGAYVVAAPQRHPAEDERVDVIFTAIFLVPFLVVLIAYAWLVHGLAGAAVWSLTSLGAHGLVQLLIRRRRLLDAQHAARARTTAELARNQEELRLFTYAVTHDLKAPVTGMGLAAETVLDDHGAALPGPARAELTDIVVRAGEKKIVDLFDMVRIVSRPEPFRTVELEAAVADAVQTLRPQIAAHRVRVDVARPLRVVLGQKTKLGHVFANLIGNAIRYVPAGAGVVQDQREAGRCASRRRGMRQRDRDSARVPRGHLRDVSSRARRQRRRRRQRHGARHREADRRGARRRRPRAAGTRRRQRVPHPAAGDDAPDRRP